jgi:hypothetical protein
MLRPFSDRPSYLEYAQLCLGSYCDDGTHEEEEEGRHQRVIPDGWTVRMIFSTTAERLSFFGLPRQRLRDHSPVSFISVPSTSSLQPIAREKPGFASLVAEDVRTGGYVL